MSLIDKEKLIAEYDRVHIGPPGMMGREVVVDKQLLREAQVYLEDYLAILEGDV